MSTYPTQLRETAGRLPAVVDQAELNVRGLYVVEGLDVSLAEQLVVRSTEPHIAEYCPNDPAARFKDFEAVVAWQAKGRLALPLVKEAGHDALRLVGFAWTGPQTPAEDEPAIPGAVTTFAIRIYREAVGQGNALPYTRAVLAANDAKFGNKGVWLEAWGDNAAAVRTYEKAGFRQVAEVPGTRRGEACSRVYMLLGQTSLPGYAKTS